MKDSSIEDKYKCMILVRILPSWDCGVSRKVELSLSTALVKAFVKWLNTLLYKENIVPIFTEIYPSNPYSCMSEQQCFILQISPTERVSCKPLSLPKVAAMETSLDA